MRLSALFSPFPFRAARRRRFCALLLVNNRERVESAMRARDENRRIVRI